MVKFIENVVIAVCMLSTIRCQELDLPSVILKDGSEIVGIFEEFNNDDLPVHAKLESYYGIPYAEPPIGDLRFKPPVAKGKLDSPFSASKVGPSCHQIDPAITGLRLTNEEMSEDCLFLDVIVPHPKPSKAPVVVSIHGGGFLFGAANIPYASFRPLVSYGDIIAVTMNYRLNALGFLTTGDDLIPGNFGLLDQQLALKWVNENIASFGGDPQKVTIHGVSAGSASVGYHMLSPGSSGLFQNGIMESGSPLDMWNANRSSEEGWREVKTLAKLIECNTEDTDDDEKLVKCLKAAPAKLLVEKIYQVSNELGNLSVPLPGPNIDGVFLQGSPMALMEAGKVNGKSVIIGTNADEGTAFLAMLFPDKDVKPVVNASAFGAVVDLAVGAHIDPALHDLIKMVYAKDPSVLLDDTRDDFFAEATKFLGDGTFLCSESKYARTVSSFVDVYRYTMTYTPSKNLMDQKWAGAAHADELQYVLGAIFEEMLHNTSTKEERDLARTAMSYWLNFIKTGNPNTPQGMGGLSLNSWPKFTKEDEIVKDLTPSMRDIHMERTECYFFEHMLPPLMDAFDELRELRQTLNNKKTKPSEESSCEGAGCHHDEGTGKDEL